MQNTPPGAGPQQGAQALERPIPRLAVRMRFGLRAGAVSLLCAGWLVPMSMQTTAHATDPRDDGSAPIATSSNRTGDIGHPIYYPHSPHLRRHHRDTDDEVGRLLDGFVHLHSATRYDEALEVIEQLIALMPENAVMHYNRACVLGRLHRTDEAIDAINRAIELGWRNLSHMQVDPDLQAVRWSDRYGELAAHLAAKIRRERPTPGPLREESWEDIVRDLEAIAPSLLISNNVPTMTIAFVHDRKHVWTGTFAQSAGADRQEEADGPCETDDRCDLPRPESQRPFRVEAPAQLLAVLGVLDQRIGDDEPGVIRLVKLCRHAAEVELAASPGTRRVGHGSRGGANDAAGAFEHDPRRSGNRNRRVAGGRVLRISHVPDNVHELLRLAVEHLSGESFIRYCHERVFPTIGMEESEVVIVGQRDRRTVRAASRTTSADEQADSPHDSWAGPPRPILETTAGDLAAMVAYVLAMEQSDRLPSMNWHQIGDYLLRSCATRELSIGSGIMLRRIPFGLRTDIVSTGGGSGCVMRWHSRSGSGVVVLFEDQPDGTALRMAERLAHLALGGEP